MIRLQAKWTNAATFRQPLYGTGHQVTEILIGAVEDDPSEPDEPYYRYLHIVTQEGQLALELWAATVDALTLSSLAEADQD